MQMAEKHTPLGQIEAVFLSPARSQFLYITQNLRISDNPYICTMTILLVPTFGLAVGLEIFPADAEWRMNELVLNILLFKIIVQWQAD
jgi:hypothetical protein